MGFGVVQGKRLVKRCVSRSAKLGVCLIKVSGSWAFGFSGLGLFGVYSLRLLRVGVSLGLELLRLFIGFGAPSRWDGLWVLDYGAA